MEITYTQKLYLRCLGGRNERDVIDGHIMMGDGEGNMMRKKLPHPDQINVRINAHGCVQTDNYFTV